MSGLPLEIHDAPTACLTSCRSGQVIDSKAWFGECRCRAHAVAFAVLTRQSALLKAHFPVYLYAGLLEHDPEM